MHPAGAERPGQPGLDGAGLGRSQSGAGTVTAMVKTLGQRAGLLRALQRGASDALGPAARGTRPAAAPLVELFLVKVMGMDWSEVHSEAERWSTPCRPAVDRMDEMLATPPSIPTATRSRHPRVSSCRRDRACSLRPGKCAGRAGRDQAASSSNSWSAGSEAGQHPHRGSPHEAADPSSCAGRGGRGRLASARPPDLRRAGVGGVAVNPLKLRQRFLRCGESLQVRDEPTLRQSC